MGLLALAAVGATLVAFRFAGGGRGVAIADAAAPEGNRGRTALVFTVTRPGGVGGIASVSYAIRSRRATAGRDFVRASGRLVFARGERAVGLTVAIRGDRTPERDETIEVVLSAPTGVGLEDAVARGTIIDDDRRPDGPLVAVAGDIACDPEDAAAAGGDPAFCQHRATAALLRGATYTAVIVPGDVQYDDGARAKFATAYGPTWGRVKARTRPVPGNHEYRTPAAAGYFDYFGAGVGRRGEGWYSFDVGDWHLVGLNSNCAEVGGCGAGSVQERWLRADLAAHPARCTLAFWHHPRFTSGAVHLDATEVGPLWTALEDAGADVVLAGHAHDYERFRPQTAAGVADPDGIRAFVVGTGGRSHQPIGPTHANSEVLDATSFGILELTLGRSRYSWRFRAAVGSFGDRGSSPCH